MWIRVADGGGDHCRDSVNWGCGMAVVAAAWDMDEMGDIAALQPSRNERGSAMLRRGCREVFCGRVEIKSERKPVFDRFRALDRSPVFARGVSHLRKASGDYQVDLSKTNYSNSNRVADRSLTGLIL